MYNENFSLMSNGTGINFYTNLISINWGGNIVSLPHALIFKEIDE